MTPLEINRRRFLQRSAAGVGALALAGHPVPAVANDTVPVLNRPEYRGPNVILIRFGGGVRRRETIDLDHTYAPYFRKVLCPRGTLFTNMMIDQLEGVATSHGQGTLYLLTGKYDRYEDVTGALLGQRFESKVPTLFEYLRKRYDVPEHQTLIINGEDRTDEEFYSFSNHHLFGVKYRSNVLSLYRFKVYLLRRQIAESQFEGELLAKKKEELEKLEAIDHRDSSPDQSPEIDAFWARWREHYGETGLVNPRGDRLLTELTVRAIRELRPKLIMVNYNDPDYVHWGNPSTYTRGIQIIDQGLQRIAEAVQNDEEYRDNTVFAIVPDCGRDSNRAMPVPFQHHFNSKSAHEIFGLFFGPGIERGQVIQDRVEQISVASTLGQVMQVETRHAEAPALEQVFA